MYNYSLIINLILISIFFFSCDNDLKNAKTINDDKGLTIEQGENIEVYFSENGIKSANLFAPTMQKIQDSLNKTVFNNGLKLLLYNPDGTLSSTLTSKYGEMDHTTNQMIAKDSVKVVSTNGQILSCNHLIWKQNERILTTYKEVYLKTPTETLFGDTLIADENLKIYTIKKLKGIVTVKK